MDDGFVNYLSESTRLCQSGMGCEGLVWRGYFLLTRFGFSGTSVICGVTLMPMRL